MPRWLYSLLLRLAVPFVLAAFTWRGWRQREHRSDLRARLALGQPAAARPRLWLHGASVGEVQAAAGLIRMLRERHPDRGLLLTTFSATGMTRAKLLYADLIAAPQDGEAPLELRYAPFDLPGASRRFLSATQPTAAILIETELWPNLIAAAAARGIPLAMVSARVSEASTLRYLRYARGLMRETLSAMGLVGAQSEADAERFLRLGAHSECVRVLGNVKFDFPLPKDIVQRGEKLRARCGAQGAMWVAGSTHPGEEEACLEAHRELLARAAAAGNSPPQLVIAPRRPERFDTVADLLKARGLVFQRRSQLPGGDAPWPACEVLLLDTLGELLDFYAAADVAFVGGSLARVGGHNLLEPAALGKPVLAGPHTFNAPDAARLLESADALVRIHDAVSLTAALVELMESPGRAAAQGARAAAAVQANRGAVARSLAALEGQLRARGSGAR